MALQSHQTSRLTDLAARMARLQAQAIEAKAALTKAERRCERIEDQILMWREEYDQERLRLWGNAPDVAALLQADGSPCFYAAGKALAEAHGLGYGMQWADTKQAVLHVQLNRDDPQGVVRTAAAVRFFAPFVKSKAGFKRFGVQHKETSEFGLELRFVPKSGLAKLLRLRYGMQEDCWTFDSLELSLQHISRCHWLDDIIDVPAGAWQSLDLIA